MRKRVNKLMMKSSGKSSLSLIEAVHSDKTGYIVLRHHTRYSGPLIRTPYRGVKLTVIDFTQSDR